MALLLPSSRADLRSHRLRAQRHHSTFTDATRLQREEQVLHGELDGCCPARQQERKDCKSKKSKRGDSSSKPTTCVPAASDASTRESGWIVDIESSRHVVEDIGMFENATSCSSGDGLTLPNRDQLAVTTNWSVALIGERDGATFELRLADVYYTPTFARNLISLGGLARRGCKAEGRGDKSTVLTSGRSCSWLTLTSICSP